MEWQRSTISYNGGYWRSAIITSGLRKQFIYLMLGWFIMKFLPLTMTPARCCYNLRNNYNPGNGVLETWLSCRSVNAYSNIILRQEFFRWTELNGFPHWCHKGKILEKGMEECCFFAADYAFTDEREKETSFKWKCQPTSCRLPYVCCNIRQSWILGIDFLTFYQICGEWLSVERLAIGLPHGVVGSSHSPSLVSITTGNCI